MIITVSHQKGGVGKSTVAWNIAVNFAALIPTTIIDLDTQRSLTTINTLRSSEGLVPLTIEHCSSVDELTAYIKKDTRDHLTIIDSGGFDSSFNRIAILASDLLITPVSDKPFDLMGLQRYEDILKDLSKIQGEKVKTHILFNNINPAMKKFGDLIEFICSSEHFELLVSVLRQRVDFAHSVGEGKSVKEYRPHSKANEEMDELFNEIKTILDIK
jgi:chromosome partitioning protein